VSGGNSQKITPWARELIGQQSVDVSDNELKEEYFTTQ